VIYGGDDDDELIGNAGDDTLIGGLGNDSMTGGNDNDILYDPDGGDDTLTGGNGDDTLYGGPGADELRSGSGNDTLYFDPNDLLINGNADTDPLIATSSADFVNTDDSIFVGAGGNIELVYLLEGEDIFVGDQSGAIDVIVLGGDDDDQIWGGIGNEHLAGEGGNDYLYGMAGNDTLYGGAGDDIYYFGRGDDDDTIVEDGNGGNGLVIYWGWADGAPYDGVSLNEIGVAINSPTSWTVTFVVPDTSTPTGEGSITFNPNEITSVNLWDFTGGGTRADPYSGGFEIREFEWNGSGYDEV
jgi:Ca2+-binding RTX toxin-like protein